MVGKINILCNIDYLFALFYIHSWKTETENQQQQAADTRGTNWVVLDDFLRQERESFNKFSCH